MPVLSYNTPALRRHVQHGRKTHSIRFNKRKWKKGDTAYHATGVRSSKYHCFRTDLITHVDDIAIRIIELSGGTYHTSIHLNHFRLSKRAIERLALADGFSSTSAFFSYFRENYGLGLHHGQLIHWDSTPMPYVTYSILGEVHRDPLLKTHLTLDGKKYPITPGFA